MAGQEKEIGLVELEMFLSKKLPDSKKVNSVIEQLATSKHNLEKEMGEEVPSFYAEIFGYLSTSENQDINKLIDKDGNLGTGYIQNIYKKIKKKCIIKRAAEEEKRKTETKRQQDIDEIVEQMTPKEVKERIDKIDFKNLKIEDLEFLRDHSTEIVKDLNEEDYDKVVDALGERLGTQEVITELQKLCKRMQKQDYKPTKGDIDFARTIPDEIADMVGLDKNNCFFSELKKSEEILISLVETQAIMNIQVQNLTRDVENGFRSIESAENAFQNLRKGYIESENNIFAEYVIGNSFENLYKQNQQNKQYSRIDYSPNLNFTRTAHGQSVENSEMNELNFSGMEAEFSDGLAEFDSLETQAMKTESIGTTEQQKEDVGMDFLEEFADALAEFDLQEELNEVGAVEDIQQMQEVAELAIDDQMSEAIDYAETLKKEQSTELGDDKKFFVQEEQPEQDEIPMQEAMAQDVAQEEIQAESELKDYEIEVEEKTGLAGLFSKVKSFIQNIPAIQGLFARTNKQERLGAGKPEVTREDGIKQTSYFGNGSLEPLTVRARNFAINLGSNVMEAIGRVTGTSDKENTDIPINRPTIIKSEEKTNERAVEEQQINNMKLNPTQQQQMDFVQEEEQQGKKMDDNPWAVTVNKNMEKEALIKSANTEKIASVDKKSQNRDEDDGTIGF